MIASNHLLANLSHPNIFCAHSLPINIQKCFTFFFVSDENSGWLPISLLLIISFSFDLNYDCSVRHTHLFIFLAWQDELFGDCTDWRTLKWLQKQAGVLWECTHGCCFFFFFPCSLYSVSLASSASCCVKLILYKHHVAGTYFTIVGCLCLEKKKSVCFLNHQHTQYQYCHYYAFFSTNM